MSPRHRLGMVLVVVLGLAAGQSALAQFGGASDPNVTEEKPPSKLTGPTAKKADDQIAAYTTRLEKEVDQTRKEIERLRAELHELIDVRSEMAATIAEVRGELAAKGTYSPEPVAAGQAAVQEQEGTTQEGQGPAMRLRRDVFYGLGSALPKDPTPEQRDQLKRLAPRAELKRMVDRLRKEVEETRGEIDQLAYQLLELRSGVPSSYSVFNRAGRGMMGMGGGMGGMGGGMNGIAPFGPWFGSMGTQHGMGGMGGGMR